MSINVGGRLIKVNTRKNGSELVRCFSPPVCRWGLAAPAHPGLRIAHIPVYTVINYLTHKTIKPVSTVSLYRPALIIPGHRLKIPFRQNCRAGMAVGFYNRISAR